MLNSGIYKITNLINNKTYIGSSCQLNIRKNQHFSELRLNKHKNIHLQRAFNKHGEKAFKFEILEIADKKDLLKLEQFYLDNLKPQYNIAKIAECPLLEKQSIDKVAKAKWKSILQYDLDGNFIKEWKSIKEAQSNLNFTFIGEGRKNKCNNSFYMFLYKKGDNYELKIKKYSNNLSKKVSRYFLNGELSKTYNSLTEAIKENNSSITYAIKNNKVTNGFKWKFE